MGCHLELSLVTEYNDERVRTEAMLTRQGANEVRIDRGGSGSAPWPKVLAAVGDQRRGQSGREGDQDEERGQNTKGADPVHPNIPGLNLPNKHPPPRSSFLG